MIYEGIAEKTNQTARKLSALFLLGAAALMLVTMLFGGIPFRWVFQLLAVGLLIGTVFLIARYESKTYIYRLIEQDGGVDLTVTEANAKGRGQVTVCRIGIDQLLSCTTLDVSEGDSVKETLARLKKEKKKRFDYCADLRPAKSILLLVEDGDDELAIRLSFDERLFSLLGTR